MKTNPSTSLAETYPGGALLSWQLGQHCPMELSLHYAWLYSSKISLIFPEQTWFSLIRINCIAKELFANKPIFPGQCWLSVKIKLC